MKTKGTFASWYLIEGTWKRLGDLTGADLLVVAEAIERGRPIGPYKRRQAARATKAERDRVRGDAQIADFIRRTGADAKRQGS